MLLLLHCSLLLFVRSSFIASSREFFGNPLMQTLLHSCSIIVVNTDFFGSTFGEIHVPWDWEELNKPLDPDPVDLEDAQAEVD